MVYFYALELEMTQMVFSGLVCHSELVYGFEWVCVPELVCD